MEEIESKETKVPSRLTTSRLLAVLTLVAGGGAGFAGMLLAPPPAEKTEIPAELPQRDRRGGTYRKSPRRHTASCSSIPLRRTLPIRPKTGFACEVALQFDGAPDVALAETITRILRPI